MSLVRRIYEPGKGCGVVLNESAVKGRLYCGVKSVLDYGGQTRYHLCEDCYLRYVLSEDMRTK